LTVASSVTFEPAPPEDVRAEVGPGKIGLLLKGAIPLLVATAVLNGSNYLFHIVISRMLGPRDYGALASLLGTVLVISVPAGVVQTVVAKRVSVASLADQRAGERFVAGAMKGIGRAAFVALAVCAFASPLLAAFLHVEVGAVLLLAPYVYLSLLSAVAFGGMQGQLRFVALAGVALAGVAVRLLTGILLVHVGEGPTGAVAATVLAQLAVFGVSLRLIRLPHGWSRERGTLQGLRGELGLATSALAMFWLLAEIDIVLARHFLPAAEGGIYSAAGFLARSLLFLPAAVSIVALPRFAAAHATGSDVRRWLHAALRINILLLALAFPGLVLLRGLAVDVTYGPRFAAAADLLPLLAVGTVLLALINVLVYFHIAIGSHAARIAAGGIVLEVLAVAVAHRSAYQIGTATVVVSGLVTLALYIAAECAVRWGTAPSAGMGPADPLLQRSPTLDLSIVLPCHNAEHGLADVIEALLASDEGVRAEIIIVSDGSTDGTPAVARRFSSRSVRLIEYEARAGKGHALKVGLREARGRYVAFMDSDGDIEPGAIGPLVQLMRMFEPDIVLGSKRHPLSRVDYPASRRFLSWTYHKITRLLFRINVRDTQTGLKVIRRDVLAEVLPRMLEKRYAFDLELLVVARLLGYTRVFEAPVRIDYRFDSQIDVRAAGRILLDTVAIFYRRYILGTYGRMLRRTLPTIGRSRLRIAIVNWRDVTNPDAGGAEVVTHEVAKRWVAGGHEVRLLTSMYRGALRVEMLDGVRIERFGHLRTGTFHLRAVRALRRLRDTDVVVDEINTVPFFTPLWRRMPSVAVIHQLAADVLDAELPRPLAAFGRRIEPTVLRLYREAPVVTVSASTRRDLVRIGLRNVTVIPQGGDEPRELTIPKETVATFLFVGRLAGNKRPDHAVAAFRAIRESLPDAKLWVVGRGPLERRLALDLPAGAEMLGFLSRDEMYERMARAHCLLVTSVREGWGLVVTEAAAGGTPAVGYDVPGIRDSIIDGVTGLLTTDGDPREMGRVACAFASDPERIAAFGRAGRQRAADHTWERTADALMAVVQRSLFEDEADAGRVLDLSADRVSTVAMERPAPAPTGVP
jgi:glycosyltransferase involved in cell wall biosynthesis/O-antigen/teichoic acid export membrane protein